jgi:hypothetical protein
MRAQVAVSSLVPNPNPEPIHGVELDVEGIAADNGHPPPTMPEERPTAPTLSVGPKRRGRPRKNVAPVQNATAPTPEQEALQPLYAKVGKLAILAAREGKDVASFAHELRELLTAYDQLLGRL